MKKSQVIRVAATKEHEVTQENYYCDICTELIGTTLYRKNVCELCKRHCHDSFRCGDKHPEDHGDYPRTLCRECVDLYYQLMIPLEREHEQAEEAMLERIKKESLNER